ncbi:MFS general substrate transporter [Sphaerulina musiva SO2202]|uniref:MFS general substrate transporter n=1 Tax=Sphaerulina musiva (strain SO2202) TaxID=692275 RepID=M3D8I4_SPHMS|nr:MFS general substrate transporter [Sphaerulina musiva SO2202]EMF14204.1 MFS general substrate transporter [Sphaerulina musiva SO2202]
MEMNTNARELHELEQELHIDIVPGTEVMTDVGSHHFVKGGGASSQVLVPQPSEHPHDPLNWSQWWKMLCITSTTVVTFTQGFGPLALAPMFGDYIKEFDSNLHDVVKFTGVCILVLGFSNFIWVPISTSCGRRPVFILSQIVCLVASIWRARATSYGSFMGACILNGIGAGPAETIQPAVIADIFFLHDRGFWNTLYWVAYMGSLMVGPIVSGSMALHLGWRSFWWLNVGLLGLSLAMVIFMFPETKWHRLHPDEIGTSSDLKTVDTKNSTSADTIERPMTSRSRMVLADEWHEDTEKSTSGGNITRVQSNHHPHHSTTSANNNRVPWLGKGAPGRSQWGIYTPTANPWKSIFIDLWTPWKLFAFPIVEFASFVVSWSCSSFLTVNLTQSQAFAAPPYNFSSQTIGFFNFAILGGSMLGLFTAGPLSDWVSARATKKNRGIREPEMRLPAMIPYVFIMILGNCIVAFGYDNHWPWQLIVILGYACAGIQVAALPAMVTTYAVDSYKPVAGSLMVSITVNKNLWGYGFSEFITPWATKHGFVPPIMTNMSLVTLWCALGVVFYFWGKQFRRWSRNSGVHRL